MTRVRSLPDVPYIGGGTGEDCLLTAADAAKFLAVPESRLKWWRSSAGGRGPSFVTIEGTVRYSLRALRRYVNDHTTVRTPRAPFYRLTKIESLGQKHAGLRAFVEERQHRRVPNPEIAAGILDQWGETVSEQALSNFFQLRLWPAECREAQK